MAERIYTGRRCVNRLREITGTNRRYPKLGEISLRNGALGAGEIHFFLFFYYLLAFLAQRGCLHLRIFLAENREIIVFLILFLF